MIPLRVFIGYDKAEAVAFHVLAHSILRRASAPVAIIPLVRGHLNAVHSRPRGPKDSTDFSITRFLVPYLSGFHGLSIFMDCDMIVRTDIHRVLDDLDASAAVSVCKHEYTPKTERKFLGQEQTKYGKKNWSSFMVFRNALCAGLTPEYVDDAPGLDLHQFRWVPEGMVGSIPLEWNWLLGEYAPNPDARVLHYTLGGPWFPECRGGPEESAWMAEYHSMARMD